MSERTYMTPELEAEVKQWVDRLLAGPGQNRQQAASELSRLGVWTRGSVRTRGTLSTPAENCLPEQEKLQDVMKCLEDTDQGVRCQVALALGEWGDERAAIVLSQRLPSEANEEVQLYYITALRTIGGPTAAEGLRLAAGRGTEAVRDAAIAAIEELATGGPVEYTEKPAVPTPAVAGPRGVQPTRGSVRPQDGAVVDSIVATLQGMRADDTASEYLRLRAEDVLASLLE